LRKRNGIRVNWKNKNDEKKKKRNEIIQIDFSPPLLGAVLQHLNANSCDTRNSDADKRIHLVVVGSLHLFFYLQHIDMTAIELPARWIV
jgi:hypothetical protein